MDITTFMTWFLSQVINIFTYVFTTLDNITFMGISLLQLNIGLVTLGVLLPVLLTIPVGMRAISERVPRQRSDKKNDNKQ